MRVTRSRDDIDFFCAGSHLSAGVVVENAVGCMRGQGDLFLIGKIFQFIGEGELMAAFIGALQPDLVFGRDSGWREVLVAPVNQTKSFWASSCPAASLKRMKVSSSALRVICLFW